MMRKQLILASASPRRKELMQDSGLPFQIIPSKKEEIVPLHLPAAQAIEQLALQKASDIFSQHPDAVVIGCDTMVLWKEERLGKPKDQADALRMLKMLSNQTHEVITGVALLSKTHTILFHETTKVTFYDLEEELLTAYVASDEPYDKAGAYGIQGMGKLLVKSIEGDYFNVVGLPISRVYRELLPLLHE